MMISTPSRSAILWLRLSVLYLLAGIALGIAMGGSQNFTMRPVHAHLNLIGWATTALSGLVYTVFPRAAGNRLAQLHFWLFNLSLPLMMGSLAMMLIGQTAFIPVLAGSEMVLAAGILAFAANVFLNVGKE